MTNLVGPDISFYQDSPDIPGVVDFEKMKSAGARFVIIRAGQSGSKDRAFETHWENAKLAGIPRGSYWFYDSRSSPKAQADLWISTFEGDYGEMPLWCDFEENYGGTYQGWRNWYDFMERLRTFGVRLGIYTGYYYWVERTIGLSQASLDYFKQYPLWIANYGVSNPRIPSPWTDWTLWQYTSSGDGYSYGVESKEIDLNYCTPENLNILLNEQENNTMAKYRVTVVWPAGANVKNGPNTGGSPLDTYAQGETFLADEIVPDSVYPSDLNKMWAKVSAGQPHNGKDNTGKYVAVLYPSSSGDPVRATWTEITEPPPTQTPEIPDISSVINLATLEVRIESEVSLKVIYKDLVTGQETILREKE